MVHVEAFGNHHGSRARNVILKLLDTNHDGALSADESATRELFFTVTAGAPRKASTWRGNWIKKAFRCCSPFKWTASAGVFAERFTDSGKRGTGW